MLSIKTLEDIYITEELREKLFTKTVPLDLWRFVHSGDKNAKEKSISRGSEKNEKAEFYAFQLPPDIFRASAFPRFRDQNEFLKFLQ